MKHEQLSKNISYFILAVCIIAVYKTFDSIGTLFAYIGDFLSLLSPIFWAFAIAFVLYPLCKKLEIFYSKSKKLASHAKGYAVATVYIIAFTVLAGFLAIMLPIIFKSVTDFIRHLPAITESIKENLNTTKIGNYSLDYFVERITVTEVVEEYELNNVNTYVSGFTTMSKSLVNFALSIIISVYILLDRASFLTIIRKLTTMFFPPKGREVFTKYTKQTFNIMYKYIYCQLLDVCFVAVIALIALLIMGVDYAPILAIFIGVANLVPYFGATIACALTALLTVVTTSLSKGIVVAVVLIVLQQIDSNIIQPRIVKNALKVKPFWVLCGVIVGGGLFGMLGILLAVPVMALIKVIFEDFYDYHLSLSKEKKPLSSAEEIPKKE